MVNKSAILHFSQTDSLLDSVVQLSEGDDVVGESLSKLPPGLGARLLPDLGGELQLDRVNVPAVPGAVHLGDPAASVVLVSPGCRLSEDELVMDGINENLKEGEAVSSTERISSFIMYVCFSLNN